LVAKTPGFAGEDDVRMIRWFGIVPFVAIVLSALWG
jgi:hypothetical protein